MKKRTWVDEKSIAAASRYAIMLCDRVEEISFHPFKARPAEYIDAVYVLTEFAGTTVHYPIAKLIGSEMVMILPDFDRKIDTLATALVTTILGLATVGTPPIAEDFL